MNDLANLIKQKTGGGWEIYKYIFNQSGIELIKGKNQNLLNPFYKDSNASLSIFEKEGEYLFNDFGDNKYSGDSIQFASHFYNLDSKSDFIEIIRNISDDLNIPEITELIENKRKFVLKELFDIYDTEFWSKYGITDSVLERFNVKAVKTIEFSGNRPFTISSNYENPIFAYIIDEKTAKIYQPFARNKKYKFSWIDHKPANYIFGLDQLPDSGKTVIITGGEKDVMTLSACGFNSITLNSETSSNIPNDILNGLRSRFEKIIVLYDIDETGQDSANKLSQKYGFPNIELPELLTSFAGKDVSDYYHHINRNTNSKLFNHDAICSLIDKAVFGSNKTCCFEDEDYNILPTLFNKICSLFEDPDIKLMMLFGALTVTSSIIPNVIMYRWFGIDYPNLFLLVIGKAGAGKGKLNLFFQLIDEVHEFLKKEQKSNHENLNKETNLVIKKNNYPGLLIPADNSSTGFNEMLYLAAGRGLLLDTEADSASTSFKSEHGNYSPNLRKAFHYEPIDYYRRKDKEKVSIKKPIISVLLSGTPKQAFRLIPNIDDGLASRFMYYIMQKEPQFDNVFGKKTDYKELFAKIGEPLLGIYKQLNQRKKPLEIDFTKEHQEIYTDTFQRYMEWYAVNLPDNAGSIVRRLGLICHKIIMILTVFRNVDKLDSEILICSEVDFKIGLALTKVLSEHVIVFASEFDSEKILFGIKSIRKQLYEQLPEKFSRSEGLAIALRIGISVRTYDRFLSNNSLFESIKHGRYAKK